MAKNKVYIDIEINGNLQKVAVDAKKLSTALGETSTNAAEADRRIKGAAQASSNSTKNFSKMAQSINTGLVPAYATLAANVFAISAAFNFLKRAADVENLRQSQINYAKTTGYALGSVTAAIQEASNGMLGFKEAAQAAAIGSAKGFTSSQLTDMAQAAAKAAASLGREYEDTFDRIIRGVSKAEPELLDELGVTLRLETATKNYADAIGKKADALTTAEKSQAVYVETMKQLNENFGQSEVLVNPFVQLSKTFDAIVKQVTSSVLPTFKYIADFLNNNAQIAVVAFGTIGGLILTQMLGIREGVISLGGAVANKLISPFRAVGNVTGKAFNFISSAAEKASESIDNLEASMKDVVMEAEAIAQGRATAMVEQGSSSKLIKAISEGKNLSPQKAGMVKKQLEAARKEFEDHGEITKGIFKGVSREILEDFEDSMKYMGKQPLTLGQKFKRGFTNIVINELKGVQRVARVTGKVFEGIGWAARKAAAGVKILGKATVILAIVGQIYEVFKKVMEAPATLVRGVINMIATLLNGFQYLANGIVNLVNSLIKKLPAGLLERLGIDPSQDAISQFTFADDAKSKLEALAESMLKLVGIDGGLQALQDIEEKNKSAEALQNGIEGLADSFRELGTTAVASIEAIDNAMGNKKTTAMANALISLPLVSKAQELRKKLSTEGVSEDQKRQLIAAFKESLGDLNLGSLGVSMDELLSGDLSKLQKRTAAASGYTASLTSLKQGIAEFRSTNKGGDPLSLRFALQGLEELRDAANSAAAGFSTFGSEAQGMLDESLGFNFETMKSELLQLERMQQNLALKQQDLKKRGIIADSAPGAVGSFLKDQIAIETSRTEITAAAMRVKELNRQLLDRNLGGPERQGIENELQKANAELEVARLKSQEVTYRLSEIGQIGTAVGQSLASSMASAFDGLIQGTMSAKEAFKSMAMSMLQSIAKVLAELMTARLLMSAFGGSPFGAFLGIPAARTGGVFSMGEKLPGYAVGGIASGPRAGYPVELHGTEAVVPLPNGKSIPVDMKGGTGSVNNVTVNVNMSGDKSSTEQQGGQGMGNLGKAIAAAVQEELQNQKRSGGILNPYGVA